jgi:hypothetical protein
VRVGKASLAHGTAHQVFTKKKDGIILEESNILQLLLPFATKKIE